MADIKDKIVTVESLKALHEYNEAAYEVKEHIVDLTADFRHLLEDKFDKPENNIVPITNGGTSASNGATGLKNLFASGATVLSIHQYGDTLPDAGTVGRIFFKRLNTDDGWVDV